MARRIKVLASIVIVLSALVGLLWSSLREGTEYFLHIDEVMTNPRAWEGKQLQVHGYVVPGSRLRNPDSLAIWWTPTTKASYLTPSTTKRKWC